MNTDKHTCVCATCGQGFTRRSSAVRHTNKLHSGQAIIVKPYDYIIGRMKGEFSPGDPAIYRGNQRNHTNSIVSGHPFQTKANDRIDTRIHADMHTYESHPPNSLYRGSEIPPWSVNMQSSYATNKSTEHDLKLRQLEELMYKNFPPKIAAQLFDQQARLPNTPNNDSYLESLLNWLRARSGSA